MSIEKRIWHIGTLVTVLLVLLSTRIVYWQLLRGNDLQPVVLDPLAAVNKSEGSPQEKPDREFERVLEFLLGAGPEDSESLPQPVVQRTMEVLENISRGSIYDRNGRVLVYDYLDEDGVKGRFYAEPSLAHTLGYVSGFRTGIAGLEQSYNTTLLGLDRPVAQLEQVIHQPVTGSDLILTIDSRAQRAAEDALGGRPGAVVVMDGHTGAILAMASEPRFDPNRIQDSSYVANLLAECGSGPACEGLFLNRATQAVYPPGSTWKTVTLIAALDTGQVSEQTVFDFGRPVSGPNGSYYVYRVDGGVIPDPNHRESRLSLELSYAKSANAAFARMADEMDPQTLIDYAAQLGFSRPESDAFPLELSYVPSQLANDVQSLHDNNLLRAATGIGQGELLASPLNMAMVVLAVVNDGDLPVPYLVESVRSPSGWTTGGRTRGRVMRNVMKDETAQIVKEMMVTVVKQGSAVRAGIPGVKVGGKTGTAQVGGSARPHSWFIGFAEEGDRSVVIAVVIENAGEGSQGAAPVFAQVASSAINQLGEPVEEVAQPPRVQEQPQAAAPEQSATQSDLPYTSTRQGSRLEGPGECREEVEIATGSGRFAWPSEHRNVVGDDFIPRHPGIDLGAPSGSPVYAADGGTVVFSGWAEIGYGNAVLVDHGNGFKTLYGHLSQVSTACGTVVQAGDLIGLSGSTGNVYGPHLHFEVRNQDGFVNPWNVLPEP